MHQSMRSEMPCRCRIHLHGSFNVIHDLTRPVNESAMPRQILKLANMKKYIASGGHGLIETLFVLFILAMLCGAAASAMLWMQTKTQMQTAAEDLLNDVLTARTEALSREKRVSLCVAAPPSNSQNQVLPTACAPANAIPGLHTWQQGWLMFEDDNNNGLWDAGEVLLMRHAALPVSLAATGNATVNRYISFGASGRSLALNGAFQAGTLTVCVHQSLSSTGWLLVVNAVGRPRLDKAQIANCP